MGASDAVRMDPQSGHSSERKWGSPHHYRPVPAQPLHHCGSLPPPLHQGRTSRTAWGEGVLKARLPEGVLPHPVAPRLQAPHHDHHQQRTAAVHLPPHGPEGERLNVPAPRPPDPRQLEGGLVLHRRYPRVRED